jgi:hypothetical protein
MWIFANDVDVERTYTTVYAEFGSPKECENDTEKGDMTEFSAKFKTKSMVWIFDDWAVKTECQS